MKNFKYVFNGVSRQLSRGGYIAEKKKKGIPLSNISHFAEKLIKKKSLIVLNHQPF